MVWGWVKATADLSHPCTTGGGAVFCKVNLYQLMTLEKVVYLDNTKDNVISQSHNSHMHIQPLSPHQLV